MRPLIKSGQRAFVQAAGLRQAHWRVGMSVHGAVVWRRLTPLLEISAEEESEAILKHFLAVCLRTA